MSLRTWFRPAEEARVEPRMSSVSAAGNTIRIVGLNDPELRELLSGGGVSASGAGITQETALKVAVAWRCTNVINTVMAGMPSDLMKRVDEKTRRPAVDHPFRRVWTVRPNRWQTPGEFKRLMQTHLLLRGNAYAYKRVLAGEIRELIPLDPDRVQVTQRGDLSLFYRYTRRDGVQQDFKQEEILHLRGMSLDGVVGLSVISYARESLGLSLQAEKVGARVFKNGHFRTGVFQTDQKEISEAAFKRLKSQIDEAEGADSEDAGGSFILEGGLKWEQPKLSAEDMQFLGIRAFERTDVGMYFGVPPFIYGDVDKTTSWGTGIEQQNIGFKQYTIQNWMTVWTEAIKRDCLADEDDLYVYFDDKGFFRLDAATRVNYFKTALGSGGSAAWMTPNEVREKDEMEPRDEPWANELPKQQPQKPGTQSNDDPKTAGN